MKWLLYEYQNKTQIFKKKKWKLKNKGRMEEGRQKERKIMERSEGLIAFYLFFCLG